jgi:hypothetical protein
VRAKVCKEASNPANICEHNHGKKNLPSIGGSGVCAHHFKLRDCAQCGKAYGLDVCLEQAMVEKLIKLCQKKDS